MATELTWTDTDKLAVDTARVLAADAVEKTGNGHPGTAVSLAPAAYLLYQDVMRHDPTDHAWLGRDRFVLSAGHSSLTQYIQLFLGGFGLEKKDIEELRDRVRFAGIAAVPLLVAVIAIVLAIVRQVRYRRRFDTAHA